MSRSLRDLKDAMENHGNAEGTEMQLGDAEGFLSLMWSMMTEAQQDAFLADSTVVELLEENGDAEYPPECSHCCETMAEGEVNGKPAWICLNCGNDSEPVMVEE